MYIISILIILLRLFQLQEELNNLSKISQSVFLILLKLQHLNNYNMEYTQEQVNKLIQLIESGSQDWNQIQEVEMILAPKLPIQRPPKPLIHVLISGRKIRERYINLN